MRRLAALLALALAAAACGPAAVPPAAPPGPTCSPCPTALVLRYEMSTVFRLVRVEAAVDGQPIYRRADDDRLAAVRALTLAEALPLSGDEHTLTLLLVMRGAGFGVFSYLPKYTFTVRSSHRFSARAVQQIVAHAYEKGTIATPIEQRPAVRYEEQLRRPLP